MRRGNRWYNPVEEIFEGNLEQECIEGKFKNSRRYLKRKENLTLIFLVKFVLEYKSNFKFRIV